jgi:hypothetical protein
MGPEAVCIRRPPGRVAWYVPSLIQDVWIGIIGQATQLEATFVMFLSLVENPPACSHSFFHHSAMGP